MIRNKTLSLPLVSALLASVAAPAVADVALSLSSQKTYRQTEAGATDFRGGRFDITLRDGDGIYVGGCARDAYWPPNIPLDPCPGGSTAYVLYGEIDPEFPNLGPYFWMTDVIPALIIEPRRSDLCTLEAAPASKLPRPSTDFKDSSYGLYYNLHEANVVESVITRYDSARTYNPKQRGKFEDEIVPGVYHYSFPRLTAPTYRVPISPVIYPMPEGFAKLNNQKTGVQFISNERWTKDGFMEISYLKPNVIRWKGFAPSVTYPAVDNLYFSMRFLANEDDPLSNVTYVNPDTSESPASLFPGYVSGGDPRILLANPFVDSFTLPPVFPGGSKAVIELELNRGFQTGGVTYDFSSRKFQIPIKVVNRYTDYTELRFSNDKNAKTGILDDSDKDGFNNLNEWILESRADDSSSVPRPIVALPRNVGNFFDPQPYFGFTYNKRKGTVPNVIQTLQRSTNGGNTWKKMVSDANWIVTNTPEQIIVQSRFDDVFAFPVQPVQPPGTAGHLYRIKVTLAKK
jgi:hypothetical protein